MCARNIAVKSILNIINHSFYKSDEKPLSKTKAHTHTPARIPSICGGIRRRRVFTCFEFPSFFFRFVSLRFKDNRICSLFSLSHRFSHCASVLTVTDENAVVCFSLENVTASHAYPFSSFCQRILLGVVCARVFLFLLSILCCLFLCSFLGITFTIAALHCTICFGWISQRDYDSLWNPCWYTRTHTHGSHFSVIFKHPHSYALSRFTFHPFAFFFALSFVRSRSKWNKIRQFYSTSLNIFPYFQHAMYLYLHTNTNTNITEWD